MPNVGGQEYDYTPEGIAAAEAAQAQASAPVEAEAPQEGEVGAPMATEPLDPARVNALGQTVSAMFSSVTGGEMEVPEIPEVTEAADQLPAEVFAPLVAVSMFLEEMAIPNTEQYKFDPYQLATSNDGLTQMATTVSAMASDQDFINAMQQPATAAPAQAPEAPPAPMGPAVSEEELAALA